MIIKPNNPEDHSVLAEIEVEIFCRVFEEKQVDIMQDMYSPSRNLIFKENKVNTIVNMKNTQDTINVREKVKLENLEYTNICDVYVTPEISETNTFQDRARFAGNLNLNFVLTNNNEDNVITLERKLPFDFTQEIDGINENSRINMEIIPISREFVVDDLDVNARIDLGVNTNSYNLENVNVIDDIEEGEYEENNPYSMIIYFVKPRRYFMENSKKI